MSRRFCRVIPGKGHVHFAEAKVGGFIGTDFNLQVAEEGQLVEGVIIALEDDQRLKRALSLVPSVTFYRYEVNFALKKSEA